MIQNSHQATRSSKSVWRRWKIWRCLSKSLSANLTQCSYSISSRSRIIRMKSIVWSYTNLYCIRHSSHSWLLYRLFDVLIISISISNILSLKLQQTWLATTTLTNSGNTASISAATKDLMSRTAICASTAEEIAKQRKETQKPSIARSSLQRMPNISVSTITGRNVTLLRQLTGDSFSWSRDSLIPIYTYGCQKRQITI